MRGGRQGVGIPDRADRRAHRRLAHGGGVGRALARARVRDRPQRRRHPRARRSRPGREHQIVFIGRHDARKGLPVLLRAWPEIRRRTGARLRLIGTDPLQYRLLHSRLRFDEDGIDVLGIVTNDGARARARERQAVRLAGARRRELRHGARRGVRGRRRRSSRRTSRASPTSPTPHAATLVPPGRRGARSPTRSSRLLADEERRVAMGRAARELALERATPGRTSPRRLEQIYERFAA